MNKSFHTTFEDACNQDDVLKNAQEVCNPDIISSFICQQDMIAVNGEQLDKICKMNGTISAYFEDIFKNIHDLEKHLAKLKNIVSDL